MSLPSSHTHSRSVAIFTQRFPAFLAALLAMLAASALAQAVDPKSETAPTASKPVQLDKVQVTAVRDAAAETISTAMLQLAEVPGTVSIVDLAEIKRGRAANAEDILSFQPGVIAQATSGNSANKISIRGSGLNTFYQGYSLGTKFLYDGQPVTGPGGTQEELLSGNSVSYVEVLNGPNAFNYASTSLGGAINFVTHTGHTAPGLQTRFEAGSFGYRRGEVSYGLVNGKGDYFVSVSRNERDGFQQQTPNEANSLTLNLGYKLSDRLDTRLIVRFQSEELYNGSTLNPAQIDTDPSLNRTLGLATGTQAAQSARKKQGTTVVTSKTTYRIDDQSRLELGLSNTNYPLENGWLFSNTPQDWRSNDLNVTVRYERQDELFGLPSKSHFIVSDTRLIVGDVHGYRDPRNGTARILTQYTKFNGSRDTVFAFGNETELLPRQLFFTAGLSYAELDRAVRILYSNLNTPNPLGFPGEVNYVDRNILPRAGLRFQVNPDTQLFASASKAVDAPVTWQLGSTGSSFIRPLRPQDATTLEVGGRSRWKLFEGSLTFYRSWVRNELLTIRISDDPSVLPVNANATPTIHQGIEAALNTVFWESPAGSRVSLRQTYTLNDFYYENDPAYGDNELPSLPRHAYQAELNYQHAKGFYAALNLRAVSDYYVDFANTVKYGSYAILGARVGYDTGRWQVFADLRNLTDENYASAANTAFDLGGNRTAAYNFYPGDGFNVIGGLSLRF